MYKLLQFKQCWKFDNYTLNNFCLIGILYIPKRNALYFFKQKFLASFSYFFETCVAEKMCLFLFYKGYKITASKFDMPQIYTIKYLLKFNTNPQIKDDLKWIYFKGFFFWPEIEFHDKWHRCVVIMKKVIRLYEMGTILV